MSQADTSGNAASAGSESAAAGQNMQSGAETSGSNAAANKSEAGGNELGASFLARDNNPGDSTAGKQEAKGEGQEQEEGKSADPMASIPAKPEDYKLSFAEGVSVDEGLLSGFKAKAHELGIAQGQAQKLADFYAKNVADSAKATQDAQINAIREAEKGWIAQIEARPGFKSELEDAKRTLKEFGGEELTELMNQSRLGSHPVFFDFVVKVGKALAEPEARGRGAGGGKEKPLADRLWPGMK